MASNVEAPFKLRDAVAVYDVALFLCVFIAAGVGFHDAMQVILLQVVLSSFILNCDSNAADLIVGVEVVVVDGIDF